MARLKNLGLILLGLVLAVLIAEIPVRLAFETLTGKKTRLLYESVSSDFTAHRIHQGCPWINALQAHPYLVYTADPNGCSQLPVNKQGFISHRDFPTKKSPNEFSILIMGGSVAEHIATFPYPGKTPKFEELLNARFESPNGKPFRVYNGALGSWSRPQQNSLGLIYGHNFHAWISLDGFNESFHARATNVLNTDLSIYHRLTGSALLNPVLRVLASIYQWGRNSTLKNSFIAAMVFDSINKGLRKKYSSLPNYGFGDIIESETAKQKTYQRLIEADDVLAQSQGIKFVHFLQPIRWLGKNLTAEEKQKEAMITAESYKPFVKSIPILHDNGVNAYDLTQVFAEVKETIYADQIHYLAQEDNCRGCDLVMNAMIEQLKGAWYLKPKPISIGKKTFHRQ